MSQWAHMTKLRQFLKILKDMWGFRMLTLPEIFCHYFILLSLVWVTLLVVNTWQELEGRPLRLAWARPKINKPSSPPPSKPQPIHNLFVANLHFKARSNDLLEFFRANGANVVSAEVIFHDNPRRSAGYGFVSLNTKEEADAALSSFDGKVILGLTVCSDEIF